MQMQLLTPFGAFLDPVADKVSFPLCCPDLKNCLSHHFLHIYNYNNQQPCGFISIEMAKIVVGSPSLTQPLLFYLGLGPAMLDN
jgi:hypothetical protein